MNQMDIPQSQDLRGNEEIVVHSLSPFIRLVQRKAAPSVVTENPSLKSIKFGLRNINELFEIRTRIAFTQILHGTTKPQVKCSKARLAHVLAKNELKIYLNALSSLFPSIFQTIDRLKTLKNTAIILKTAAFFKILQISRVPLPAPAEKPLYLTKKEHACGALMMVKIINYQIMKRKQAGLVEIMSYSYIPLGSSKPVDDKRHMKTEIMRRLLMTITEEQQTRKIQAFYAFKQNCIIYKERMKSRYVRFAANSIEQLISFKRSALTQNAWNKLRLCTFQQKDKPQKGIISDIVDPQTQIDMDIMKTQALVNKELAQKLLRAKARKNGQDLIMKTDNLCNLLLKIQKSKLSLALKQIQSQCTTVEAQNLKNQIKMLQKEKEGLMDRIDEMDNESQADSNSCSLPLQFNPAEQVIVLSEQAYNEYQNFITSNIKKLPNELKEEVSYLKAEENEFRKIIEDFEGQLGLENQVNSSYLNNQQQEI